MDEFVVQHNCYRLLEQTGETEDLVEKLYIRFDEIALAAITVHKLLLGLEYLGGKDRSEVEAIIESSLILPLGEQPSREAAKILAESKRSGSRIGIADELVARSVEPLASVYLPETSNISKGSMDYRFWSSTNCSLSNQKTG